ncbi:hypothetical protein SAY87_007742 [Trapa incisa]|uniref:Uncharacterized protein n=1 Tax=Trapa incisa TaxID=236973 RepID=A0AAN7QIL4_9MYRT|nr:hypothetical protein SAY87_007742 [Trapa incisa]
MAFNKLVAVFLVCIVFGAALNAEKAVATTTTDKFKSCFDACLGECLTGKTGYTFCEMRCDEDCSEKEFLDKLKARSKCCRFAPSLFSGLTFLPSQTLIRLWPGQKHRSILLGTVGNIALIEEIIVGKLLDGKEERLFDSLAMKRATPWSNEEDESSEESSSQSDSDSDGVVGKTKAKSSLKPEKSSKEKSSEGKSAKKKATAMNFEALKQHGYKGGLSVLGVPLPKEEIKQDWSWSKGKESREKEAADESYEERQRTRTALANGEQLVGVQTRKDKKMESFSQKEKRKRDLGQASRGKSYAEEEKRLLRDSGIYSGFDN